MDRKAFLSPRGSFNLCRFAVQKADRRPRAEMIERQLRWAFLIDPFSGFPDSRRAFPDGS
jgi:hypothetical protein